MEKSPMVYGLLHQNSNAYVTGLFFTHYNDALRFQKKLKNLEIHLLLKHSNWDDREYDADEYIKTMGFENYIDEQYNDVIIVEEPGTHNDNYDIEDYRYIVNDFDYDPAIEETLNDIAENYDQMI